MDSRLARDQDEVTQRLRVALVAGTLGQGGAEKQLVYIARALHEANVDVRVFCLTRGEFYESELMKFGIVPVWVGRLESPLLRLASILKALWKFKPHIIQSTHFFTNLYAALAAKLTGGCGVGSVRNDTTFDLKMNPFWGKWLLRMPQSLILNSYCAQKTAMANGVPSDRLQVLPNVLNLTEFDDRCGAGVGDLPGTSFPLVIAVGRLVQQKRWDRFIAAFAEVCRRHQDIGAVIVGDGPERGRLQKLADEYHLGERLVFLGRRDDVPVLLKHADMLVLCSDNEGFPNVLLEAMAASLPVITTPAGDAGCVVQDGATGYVVPFDDQEVLVGRMLELSKCADLRHRLGEAGRKRVEDYYSFERLRPHLLSIYREIAAQQNRQGLVAAIS